MNLLIKKNITWQKNSKIFEYFIQERLIPEIHMLLLYELNDSFQIHKWDKYLKDSFKWNLNEYPPNVYDILLQGISSLKFKNQRDSYLIHIDYNQIIPGTSAKLYDICKIINSGTLDTSPYPIFSNVFKVLSNTQTLKNLFEEFLYDLDLDLEEYEI